MENAPAQIMSLGGWEHKGNNGHTLLILHILVKILPQIGQARFLLTFFIAVFTLFPGRLLVYRPFEQEAERIMKPPEFREHPFSFPSPAIPLGLLLAPLSWPYLLGGYIHKKFSRSWRAPVPVISVGNLNLGGTGKTPVTLAIARLLQQRGRVPHIISRGYKGLLAGPVQVDPACHTYHQVGDEPLLLARIAPTWVSKNRAKAARLACQAGADILLLDDGHQNHSLAKDFSIIVVNSRQGFGNGRVFPAGPLRQGIRAGLKQADAVILIGEEQGAPHQLLSLTCPLLQARAMPVEPEPCAALAFAGIGYPEKFRKTLLEAGYQLKGFIPFADHHPYSAADMHYLETRAQAAGCPLITTEKDFVRIPPVSRKNIRVLPMILEFSPVDALEKILGGKFKRPSV